MQVLRSLASSLLPANKKLLLFPAIPIALAVVAHHYLSPTTSVSTSASFSTTATPTLNKPFQMTIPQRFVVKSVVSREQGEGDGARVRRSIGTPALRNFDPFLMLDEFKVEPPAGFPDHPHRGFETVTLMLEGVFEHEDFAGHKGRIGPGDLQWMTAGRGIVHAEMPAVKGTSTGLQLWINLPASEKMCEPRYQELLDGQIPRVYTPDKLVEIKVIAGESLGTVSPVLTKTPIMYLDVKMQKGGSYTQTIPKGFNAFVYTLKGKAKYGEPGKECGAHETLVLSNPTDGSAESTHFTVTADSEDVRYVLIGGQPINEPIEQMGPFVMNSRNELAEAYYDFRGGRNGFERAPNFRSSIADGIVH